MKSYLKFSAALLLGIGLVIPASAQFDFQGARAKGRRTACKSNLKNLATACEMYASDYSGRYPKRLSLLTEKGGQWQYLKTIPTCPSAGLDTYSETYQMQAPKLDKKGKVVSGRDYFVFYCKGHHHKDAGGAANRPAYDCEKGLLE